MRSSDPPVRDDGSCIVCGRPRQLAKLKLVYRRHAEQDPFCSSSCAREWYGVPLSFTGREVAPDDAA